MVLGLVLLNRVGIRPGPMYLLTVPGRTTRLPRTNPVGVGVRVFVRNGVVASGDPDAFAAAAAHCPVFRAAPLRPAGQLTVNR
jgi:hypothetical protein